MFFVSFFIVSLEYDFSFLKLELKKVVILGGVIIKVRVAVGLNDVLTTYGNSYYLIRFT